MLTATTISQVWVVLVFTAVLIRHVVVHNDDDDDDDARDVRRYNRNYSRQWQCASSISFISITAANRYSFVYYSSSDCDGCCLWWREESIIDSCADLSTAIYLPDASVYIIYVVWISVPANHIVLLLSSSISSISVATTLAAACLVAIVLLVKFNPCVRFYEVNPNVLSIFHKTNSPFTFHLSSFTLNDKAVASSWT